MKRYKYVVAVTCLLLSAMGFIGLYATNQPEKTDDPDRMQEIVEESEEIILGSNLFDTEQEEENQVADSDGDVNIEGEQDDEAKSDEESEVAHQDAEGDNSTDSQNEAPVGTITQEKLHFNPENGVVWPVKGTVLLDYSTEATIFFPTLQQYQYNPAIVISAKVNEKVYAVAKGKIVDISTNEETGCTVSQDLGDGYTAVYGQLKELNFEVGDMVQSGQVVGYVSEPTKYYSVEGSNVFFQLLKDGESVDPEEILP